MADNEYEKSLTGFIIHGFAVAHAATAALLSQTMIGDEAALTVLTISMIISIARINKRAWDVGDALSVIGVLAGWYLGTRGAVFLIKWIPFIGNAANAVTTFGVTELIGWTTYVLVRDNKKPEDLSEAEKENIKKQAEILKDQEHDRSKQLFEKMNREDKEEYEAIMAQLRKKDLPEDTVMYFTGRMEAIAKKYV